ncbi:MULTISPECIES: serine hydrolase [Paenibacillus]|uniref:serine hydrolase n=1 Tax=Paenibacillus TaxID=44249 RepID=UPI001C64DB95|nr:MULTISPECIES: serine hydrolase [Paenibacillus]QYK65680.1 Beta-lactamase enzyme family protein [Paenibacillus sp. S02]
MKRKRLIIVATILATVLIVMGVATGLLSFMQNQVANPPNTVRPTTAIAAEVKGETKEQDAARCLLHFVEENAEKVSITILRDGKKLAGQEENRMMPLASTVKTIIAIEYAKQAAVDQINPDERVKLISLERFYLPGLDGGAHTAWLQNMEAKGRIQNETVSVRDVAKGMIQFSSNANAEYLMDKLGLEAINRTRANLGLQNHDPIYPFVSSILIPYERMKESQGENWNNAKNNISAKEAIQAMSDTEFRRYARVIHNKLRRDVSGSYKKNADIETWYDQDYDRINTDRFIASTTADYASLMSKLNRRQGFTKAEQKLLSEVMEEPFMVLPENQQFLKHTGQKGGSTAYVLTLAMYATDKEGHSTELAVFFNDLDPSTNASFPEMINVFKKRLLHDESFRKEVNRRIGVQVALLNARV